MTRTRTILALLAAAAVSVAPVSAAGAAAPPKQRTIAQTAAGAGQLDTLAPLLEQTGLTATLQRKGPFTVFAPTDAAFAKVPKGTLAALAANPAKLRAVLLYHVANGRVSSARVVKLRAVKTLNGRSAPIRVRAGNVYAAGARVVKADVAASNGVIHLVDRVMIPR